MLRELRLALRTLLRQPGFTALAVAILALGLGATTAMFSLVNTLLLQPLPYPDADRLVRVHRTTAQERELLTSPPTFRDYRAQSTSFSGMAALITPNFTLADAGGPAERVQGGEASEDFFPLLGARPLLGRLFLAEEHLNGHDAVVVLSEGAWERLFARDPGVLGRKLRLVGQSVTVVGVLPAGFSPPLGIWGAVEIWRPMSLGPGAMANRHGHWLQIVARLRPGVTRARAQAELDVLAAAVDRAHGTRSGVAVTPLPGSVVGGIEARVTWLTLGLALLVLLIACTNLAGVQLARLAARGHEHAVRLALGASRGRLVRPALAEGLLLCVAGGGAGLLLASWTTSLLGARLSFGAASAANAGAAAQVSLDARVLGFGLALALLTALGVGTVPAWLTTRGAVADGLRAGGRSSTDHSQLRLRRGLVVAEMALALVLLAAGGLLLRGLERFAARDLGWKPDGLLSGFVTTQGAGYVTPANRLALYDRLQQRLERIPGVQSVALSGSIPRGGLGIGGLDTLVVEGAPAPTPGHAQLAALNSASPGYFATMGIVLREGRAFTFADGPDGARVAIVNETMARQLWPGQEAIGKRIGITAARGPVTWTVVVGVVADVRYATQLGELPTRFQLYFPLAQRGGPSLSIAVRGPRPESLIEPLRRAVAEVDAGLPVFALRTARDMMDRGLANVALLGWIVLGFAVLGLVMAALGVYGLFSGYVVQRTREIGVRLALGAQTGQVLALVLGKGLRLALLGAALGVAGALAVARVLTALAAELPAHDPLAIVVLAAALIVVALFACWLPARRAAALDPMAALRQE